MAIKYPTWRRANRGLYVSEEEIDGTPDFLVWLDDADQLWRVKWRTSACWYLGCTRYATASEAMKATDEQCRKGS